VSRSLHLVTHFVDLAAVLEFAKIESILANSKTQNAFLFPVYAMFRHDCPLSVKPASMPRRLVDKINLERFSIYWYAPFCCVCLGCCAAELGRSGGTNELPCIHTTAKLCVGIVHLQIYSFKLVLQPHSSLHRSNEATPLHSVHCLGFPVVNSTFLKVFFITVHPSYRESSYIPCTTWIYEC
jgi:hypothetical protein